jgi:hypothetical protein
LLHGFARQLPLILPDLAQYAFHLFEPTLPTLFFDDTLTVPHLLVRIFGIIDHLVRFDNYCFFL